jgi:hypothetical protein
MEMHQTYKLQYVNTRRWMCKEEKDGSKILFLGLYEKCICRVSI